MTNQETKALIIEKLFQRGVYTKQIDEVEYRTRCPYCGDSARENTGHFYLRINPNDNYQIVYNCFKCPAGGILDSEVLAALDITDVNLKASLHQLNKTSDVIDDKFILEGYKNSFFDYHLPEIKDFRKIPYLEKRLGQSFHSDDFHRMKLVTSLKDFLIENNITKLMCDHTYANAIEDHYIGFLTNGNSHILFRDITDREKLSWLKYPITKESKENRVFYSMESMVDIFSDDPITINLAEGVMDILSAYYNLGYSKQNTINVCVTGKYYERMLLYLIDMGFIGSNITVNIFADNDKVFNRKKGYQSTTIEHYRKLLKNYKCIYGDTNVYYNQLYKDIGVPKNKISLKRYKI